MSPVTPIMEQNVTDASIVVDPAKPTTSSASTIASVPAVVSPAVKLCNGGHTHSVTAEVILPGNNLGLNGTQSVTSSPSSLVNGHHTAVTRTVTAPDNNNSTNHISPGGQHNSWGKPVSPLKNGDAFAGNPLVGVRCVRSASADTPNGQAVASGNNCRIDAAIDSVISTVCAAPPPPQQQQQTEDKEAAIDSVISEVCTPVQPPEPQRLCHSSSPALSNSKCNSPRPHSNSKCNSPRPHSNSPHPKHNRLIDDDIINAVANTGTRPIDADEAARVLLNRSTPGRKRGWSQQEKDREEQQNSSSGTPNKPKESPAKRDKPTPTSAQQQSNVKLSAEQSSQLLMHTINKVAQRDYNMSPPSSSNVNAADTPSASTSAAVAAAPLVNETAQAHMQRSLEQLAHSLLSRLDALRLQQAQQHLHEQLHGLLQVDEAAPQPSTSAAAAASSLDANRRRPNNKRAAAGSDGGAAGSEPIDSAKVAFIQQRLEVFLSNNGSARLKLARLFTDEQLNSKSTHDIALMIIKYDQLGSGLISSMFTGGSDGGKGGSTSLLSARPSQALQQQLASPSIVRRTICRLKAYVRTLHRLNDAEATDSSDDECNDAYETDPVHAYHTHRSQCGSGGVTRESSKARRVDVVRSSSGAACHLPCASARDRLRSQWLLERAWLASRCEWLTSHLSDLEYKIRYQVDVCKQVRSRKQGFYTTPRPSTSADDTLTCARARPIWLPNKRHRAKVNTLGSFKWTRKTARQSSVPCECSPPQQPCVLCAGRLDVLDQCVNTCSLPVRQRAALLDPAFNAVLTDHHALPVDALAQHALRQRSNKTRTSPFKSLHKSRNAESAALVGQEGESGRRHVRDKKHSSSSRHSRDDKHSSKAYSHSHRSLKRAKAKLANSQRRSTETPSGRSSPAKPAGKLSSGRRNTLARYHNELDNIVIDPSVLAASRAEKLDYKEIEVPSWRAIDEPTTNNCKPPAAAADNPTPTSRISIVLGPPDEKEESDAECIEDDSYALRHSKPEAEEHKRFTLYKKSIWSMGRRMSEAVQGVGVDGVPLDVVSASACPPPHPFTSPESAPALLLHNASAEEVFRAACESRPRVYTPYTARAFPLTDDASQQLLLTDIY